MRINHPRPALGRQRDLGLEFVDGVAVAESLHLERELALRQHGYTIEADPEVQAPFQEAIGEPIIDLETLTKAELRAMLPEDADVPAKASHSDLVNMVAELPAPPAVGFHEVASGHVAVETSSVTVGGEGVVLATLSADEASEFED